MSTKGNRQKVENVLNLLSVALVVIEVPVRKYRSQPSVGCPQLTLKSLINSIILNLLSVALKSLLDSIVLNLLSVALS
jgi:hypothetical protein